MERACPIRNAMLPALAAATLVALHAGAAFAQPFPSKPIRIVVPFPPGGGVDLTARTVGQKMAALVGQPVVIENRAGAAGTIGAEFVAKGVPDGHLLLVAGPGSVAVAPLLFPKLGYDPLRDLAPVTMLVTMPFIVVAHPSIPVRNARELIAWAKANPGRVNMASGGAGTGQHLAGELFNLMAGIKAVHVPYKGTAPAIADIIGGHADLTFSDPSVLPLVKAGKLKVIGVSGTGSYEALPDAPVVAKTGLPGFDALNWYPMMAPGGTLKEIVARLNSEAIRALSAPEVREKLLAQGLIPTPMTPERLGQFIRTDLDRWSKVVKAANIRLD
ncbi:MAG: tripartite tricarboxylate transporter substrate binding protein [Proteobacteria bacterium]|nr:tripartite tricarboxylate transporter substrate binding protein [Pseudomonadota bacterium]